VPGELSAEWAVLIEPDTCFLHGVRQCKYTVEDAGAGAALLFIDDFPHNI